MTAAEQVATYADAHTVYRRAGWRGVLPLPAGAKWPPPDGFTGWHGADPSGADSQTWVDDYPEYRDTRQLALRMPVDVIGIDVDHYGDKRGGDTLAEAQRRWGALPPAPSSSARGDGVSGIYFYRVPAGTALRTRIAFPDAGLGDVEIIQRHHRYAVVWPSVHPTTGDGYLWRRTTGPDAPPDPRKLNELPPAWLDALVGAAEPGEAAADPDTVAAFARDHITADRTAHPGGPVAAFRRKIEAGSSRHDAAVEVACWAAREARAGCYPAAAARAALRDAFVLALAEARGGARLAGPAEARREFESVWAWAVGQALSLTVEQCRGRIASRPSETVPVVTPLNAAALEHGLGDPKSCSRSGGTDQHDGADHDPGHDDDDLEPWERTGRAAGGGTSALSTSGTVHADAYAGVTDDELIAALGAESAADWRERTFRVKLEEELRRRAVRRAADEQERPPAEPIDVGALRWSQIATVRPPKMRVRRLLAESAVTWLSGRSGSYKSFLGVALGLSVATGTPVAGHDEWTVSAPLTVLYVAAEGAAGASVRAQAYAAHHGLDGDVLERRFILYPKRVDLRSESGRRMVRAFVEAESIGMIVYDTWHKVTPGLEDNSRTEVGEVMSFLDELRDDHGVESVVIDHTGHAGERATGSSSKIDDADCSLIIKMASRERGPEVQRQLVVDKLKDAETSGSWDLHLVPVPSVLDDEGRAARVLAVGSVAVALDGDLHGDDDWRSIEVPVDVREYGGTGRAGLSLLTQIVMGYGSGESGITRGEAEKHYRAAVPGVGANTAHARVSRAWDALHALDRLEPVAVNGSSKTSAHRWVEKVL